MSDSERPSASPAPSLQERRLELLRALARSPRIAAGDLDAAIAEITEAAAMALDVERASVWLYSPERKSIVCRDLFERSPRAHSSGVELFASDFPAYFRALELERAIAAHDAHTDPQTSEFSASYLGPLGIGAMLDVPICIEGRMAGVVCHEHIGPTRIWSAEETLVAGSMGDFVALAFEAAERRHTEDELRKATAAARAAERAKTAFLANVSHELRTPLHQVLGFAELMLPAVSDKNRNHLARIQEAGHRLLGMVEDLLELTTIEAGRAVVEAETLDVFGLVDSLRVALEPHLATNGNQLEVSLEDAPPRLVSDPAKVRRILWSLLDNAAKFTSQGNIRLIVEARNGAFGASVVDSGIGMSQEELAGLFLPFTQVDSSLTRRYSGSGLGLAIARRLARLLGGELTLASEPGRGTTATLVLPMSRDDASVPA